MIVAVVVLVASSIGREGVRLRCVWYVLLCVPHATAASPWSQSFGMLQECVLRCQASTLSRSGMTPNQFPCVPKRHASVGTRLAAQQHRFARGLPVARPCCLCRILPLASQQRQPTHSAPTSRTICSPLVGNGSNFRSGALHVCRIVLIMINHGCCMYEL